MANTRQWRLIASELVTIVRSEDLKKKYDDPINEIPNVEEMSQLIVSEPTTISV